MQKLINKILALMIIIIAVVLYIIISSNKQADISKNKEKVSDNIRYTVIETFGITNTTPLIESIKDYQQGTCEDFYSKTLEDLSQQFIKERYMVRHLYFSELNMKDDGLENKKKILSKFVANIYTNPNVFPKDRVIFKRMLAEVNLCIALYKIDVDEDDDIGFYIK